MPTLQERISTALLVSMAQGQEWLTLGELTALVKPDDANYFGVVLWRMERWYESIRVDRSHGYHKRRFAFPMSLDHVAQICREIEHPLPFDT